MNESYQTCRFVATGKLLAERADGRGEKKLHSIWLIRCFNFPMTSALNGYVNREVEERFMGTASSFERIVSAIASLNKSEVKRRLLHFRGRIKLDFTESYLDSLSTDKLRHILLAAMTTLKGRRF